QRQPQRAAAWHGSRSAGPACLPGGRRSSVAGDGPKIGRVHRLDWDAERLERLLEEGFRGQEAACALLKDAIRCEFVAFDTGMAAEVVAQWPEGQVFSPACEVRWR